MRTKKCYHIGPLYLFYLDSETISDNTVLQRILLADEHLPRSQLEPRLVGHAQHIMLLVLHSPPEEIRGVAARQISANFAF